MSDPNLPHLEQAKQHIRDAMGDYPAEAAPRWAFHLAWAIDDIIRHIEEAAGPPKPDCICGWRRNRGVIGGQTLAEHQRWCSLHQNSQRGEQQ